MRANLIKVLFPHYHQNHPHYTNYEDIVIMIVITIVSRCICSISVNISINITIVCLQEKSKTILIQVRGIL